METYSQSTAFLMQNGNACGVTTAAPTPCGIFHYFAVEMNFWPSVSVILHIRGFKWQSSILLHSFDFHSYSWLQIRTRRIHSHRGHPHGGRPWPWITTPQNQTQGGVSSGGVIKWPPSASTSPCWWAQGYIVMSKTMAPHSSTLAWKILWMKEPGGLQSMGSLRKRHKDMEET